MKVVIDVEANGLVNPTKIWVVVCKDIDTGKYHIFRDKESFNEFAREVTHWIGHNFLSYDYPVLCNLYGLCIYDIERHSTDTLIISKLVDYSRKQGHSVESYGQELGLPKGENKEPGFFSQWSQELEDYCVRDVDITHEIYNKYYDIITHPLWAKAIETEHRFQLCVNSLHNNGFDFNSSRATILLHKVENDLSILDKEISDAFRPKLYLIREICPKRTRHGTLSRTDFRWVKSGDLSEYNGYPFCRCHWKEFNPSSHKQIIDILHNAGWSPTDKTKTHIETERRINQLKRIKSTLTGLDLENLSAKLVQLKKTGWKINETNLDTLPSTAPPPARLLAKRILLESRRRTLTEWLSLVQEDGRIHGQFYGIGAWPHRMAHQRPNTANIPNDLDTQGKKKLLGKELRSLWRAPRNRLLVGVDAEGIQLRIFAHYIDDKEFTDALVRGKKADKTDPHSLNQRILGNICRSRAAAKRFIYALLLGAGMDKLSEILDCSREEAQKALDRLMQRYQGFQYLKRTIMQKDAQRGYFIGLDGRRVPIPGETVGERKHLCMSGYLQNGEAIVMKMATLKWENKLKEYNSILVDLVHDEWQTETPNNMEIALTVARIQADSLRIVGEELGLKCPLAGSYYNDDIKDYTIGVNWSVTH